MEEGRAYSCAESLNIAPIFARVPVGVTPEYVYLFGEGKAKRVFRR